jgi:tellurite methyltransferase
MSPSPFIVEWIDRIARARDGRLRALDVAMGSGRHAGMMARAGLVTFGVDVKLSAVQAAVKTARDQGAQIGGWCADLTQYPLRRGWFDVIVVSRYLQRNLFPDLRAALAPGGVLIYETFTIDQRALGRPPTSPDHLLQPGELRTAFDEVDLLFYEEVLAPDAVARLAARARS